MGGTPTGPKQNWPREGVVEYWWENGVKKYRHWEHGRWLPGVFTSPGAPTSRSTGPARMERHFWDEDFQHPDIIRDVDLQRNAWDDSVLPRAWNYEAQAAFDTPMANPMIFYTFDSYYFGHKEDKFIYKANGGVDYPMLGVEANYYYEGLLFAAFHQRKSTLQSFVYWWKRHYLITGGRGARTLPSVNDYFMCSLGYDDHAWYWEHRLAYSEDRYGPIARSRSIASYWEEATKMAAG